MKNIARKIESHCNTLPVEILVKRTKKFAAKKCAVTVLFYENLSFFQIFLNINLYSTFHRLESISFILKKMRK